AKRIARPANTKAIFLMALATLIIRSSKERDLMGLSISCAQPKNGTNKSVAKSRAAHKPVFHSDLEQPEFIRKDVVGD
ncbi:MAG TPA: hypothetical protein VJL32_01855, partial [Candidatus Paceibacterota bacterium]